MHLFSFLINYSSFYEFSECLKYVKVLVGIQATEFLRLKNSPEEIVDTVENVYDFHCFSILFSLFF